MSLPEWMTWWVQCSSIVDELTPCCTCNSFIPTPYPVDNDDTEMNETLMSCCRAREQSRWLRHRTTSSDISDEEL